ncbi:MAG: 4-hydroxy-2-oxo-heptane,7-dioate aldolase [Ramlibacter sp.]|jgi:4-hydroxy-2-oxoheptanedioate aldolase|uniref:HpcH/HpaI aldolase/citrate lyase family protein n=1 Tax=Ramlibacter sp. TaxID=1917967 RepID=UPI002602064B|nr:HpcH/HpaI aldolase/citrate lyase family protein [Ramlibacter sp.]MDB5751799.1 4-hydroxy-2-oxo-heptane,7-dioate aldolase [Ramlibacter sp.]
MQTPVNPFKQALAEQRAQIGLWCGLADHYTTEICAGAGFDWLLLDGEHAPNDLRSLLQQAQVVAAYPGTHAVARIPMGHGNVGQALIKQYLDLGIQTLLVPMVDTAEQAAALVQCMRYPPLGIRGMGGARASRWGRIPNYGKDANAQVCLLVQAETREAIANLDAIIATEGVDGVFIGPADLSATHGHVGNPGHPDMVRLIEDSITRIVRGGKAAGILTPDETLARRYLELGATFVAVGLDNNLLVRHTSALAARFKSDVQVAPAGKTY